MPSCSVHAGPVPSGGADGRWGAASILEAVDASDRVYRSHTKLGDVYTFRLTIGNLRTGGRQVSEAWRLLREAAQS